MNTVNPRDVLDMLEPDDGALVEVFVLNSSYADWVAAVDGLVAAGYVLTMKQHETEIPVRLGRNVFSEDGTRGVFSISVAVRSQVWTTGLFSTSMIDFQGSPGSIRGESDVQDVIRFMETISRATKSSVKFAPETLDYQSVGAYLTIDWPRH